MENPVAVNTRVEQGRIGLVEGADVGTVRDAPRPADGWVTTVDGGLVVFTTAPGVEVSFRVQVLLAPDDDDTYVGAFEDVVELSYRARGGPGDVVVPGGDPQVPAYGLGFPGPGPVRARVHATELWPGRQLFIVQLWAAPEAPTRVRRTAAGAAGAAGPEQAYRWIQDSALQAAACLTFVSDTTPVRVLEAFDVDPGSSVAWSDRFEVVTGLHPDLEPFVAVLAVPGGVVAVEDNGCLGVQAPLLTALSREGRAAAAFWNVNALRTLALARAGTILASSEWGIDTDDPDGAGLDPEVAGAASGIDFHDNYARTAKDVLAAARFTGLTLCPEDLDTLEASGRAYRVVPPG